MHALQAQEQRKLMKSEGSVEGALATRAQSSQGGKGKKKKKKGMETQVQILLMLVREQNLFPSL